MTIRQTAVAVCCIASVAGHSVASPRIAEASPIIAAGSHQSRMPIDSTPLSKSDDTIDWTIGATIPDFSFTDLKGEHRALSDYRGKYVLINVWGTWSHACIREVPYLKAAYAKFRARGFEIIGLDAEEEPESDSLTYARDRVARFVADSAITWANASTVFPQREYASVRALVDRFKVKAYPAPILIDPQRRVVAAGVNDVRVRGAKLLETLEQLLPPAAPAQ